MATVYLALGSNLGNREQNIRTAIAALRQRHIDIEKISSIIETAPQGGPSQPDYLNAVVKARTALNPENLLTIIQTIEQEGGRKRIVQNGPRTIDIDILLYDRLKITTSELIIPHPRMWQRDFVMRPLQEIAPDILKEFQIAHH